jgi:thiopeptide-type bacteriocin biosynthesis protein
MATHARLLYRQAGPVLIRATTDPGGLALPENLDLHDDGDGVAACAWLERVWRREIVREAVHLASPVLAGQIDQVLAGRKSDIRSVRRVVISVASYLLRWQGRATPFGLFAGTAAVTVGGSAAARWTDDHQIMARADAQWLGRIIDRLEQCPGLLRRLPVVANNAATVRGDRLAIPGPPRDPGLGRFAALEVSVRHTGPVRTALQAASEPVMFGDLVKVICADFPAAAPTQVGELLAELVRQGFLVTGLRAPMTVVDALGHVRRVLEAADADDLPEVADLTAELRAIHDDLSRLSLAPQPTVARQSRARIAERMRAVCDAGSHPLAVTVGLDGQITVPEPVIREAEAAASALLRVTAYPFGYRHWTDYHRRFRTKYGPGASVAVLDLLADSGLGLPTGYFGAAPGSTGRMLSERDDKLLALIQQAMADGREDIVLTEPMIRTLMAGDASEMLPPPRVELACQVLAPSAAAVARGQFRLVVTAAPRPGASMAGRFAALLGQADHRNLAGSYAAGDTDALAAQLSFPPRQRHSHNVVRTPQLLPEVISLSEHRAPGREVIPLHDLAVSADSRFLYLVQLSTGRRIQPRVLHALEAGLQTPPLARFLAEVSIGRCAVYGTFDWGAASRLPYLPRLRYGKAVLAPARWLLAAADLPAPTAPLSEWESALDAWRERWRVPTSVVMHESELRLPLDLDHRGHRTLLRTRLARTTRAELREAPTPAELAWIGRPHELLIPLRRADSRRAGQPPQARLLPRPVKRDAGHLPGHSRWLYARVPGHPDRQAEILTDRLPRLFDGWDDPPLWWFRRHREMTRPDLEQHLGLYLRLSSPEAYGPAAARVADWAGVLREQGLVPHLEFVTYHPEPGRYGHGAAMAAAHEVFAADSAAALTQITLATHTGTPLEVVTAAGLVDLAASYPETPAAGMRWLIEHLPQQHGPFDRDLRETTLRLADPGDGWATLRTQPGGEDVLAAWRARRTALATYRDHLAQQRDTLPVLRSLLHLHHVRTLGVDPDRERVTNRLTRAVALRQTARHRPEIP